jgi:hypothetical protein
MDDETKDFLGRHPLFFFLLQASERDPLSLIEDPALKNEATRLMFRILESPDFIDVPEEELTNKMLGIAKGYADHLKTEITKREKLIALERAMNEARQQKDKELEKKLLAQFTEISLDKS